MAGRRLSAEEEALWRRVTETVAPLGQAGFVMPELIPPVAKPGIRPSLPVATPSTRRTPPGPGETLDGGWDRRLRRGAILPDRTLDLHGHTLASAHAALDHGLDRAIADGVRVLLLVTGRPPRAGEERPHKRGGIRASIGDWLAFSRHAGRIAAIRNAHPRHGGQGALYLILRRAR